MKKYLLAAAAALACASFLFFLPLKSKTKTLSAQTNRPIEAEGEKEEQDEPERAAHREFLMTRDPATNTVPVERLVEAERLAAQLEAGRTAASNITWTERGPNNIGGRTRAVLIDAADATGNTIWAGGVAGGLWKTTNFKAATPTWTQASGISANLAITAIAQNPSNASIIYAGTGEGYGNLDAVRGLGIYATTNGGSSWTLLSSTTTGGTNASDFYYVQDLLVNTDGSVYAAAASIFCNAGGVLKSTNGGNTWARVVGTATGSCATSVNTFGYDLERSAGGDLWAATYDYVSGAGRVWKSPAGGSVGNAGTWTNLTPTGTFQRIDLDCSKTTNNKVYLCTQGSGNASGGLRLTTDGGTNWSPIDITSWCDQGTVKTDYTRGQAWYDLIIATDPTNDATVLTGGVDVMRSTNSGTAWSQLTQWAAGCAALPYVHADIHNIVFYPGSSTELIVGCDGGLFYSSNGGTSFTAKNNSYNVTQYYSIALHPTAGSNYMLGGTQDNGSHKFSTAGINAVTTASGGDGGFCHIDEDNPLKQYTSFTGSTLNYSANGGSSFTFVVSLSANRFINPTDYDPATDIIYGGGAVRNLRRLSNITTSGASNANFTVASTTNHSVSAVKVDPNTANRVWVAFSTADAASASVAPELYIINSANGTPTSTLVTLPAGIATAGRYVSSIDIENGNANHAILTLSNYGVPSVWETTDGGANWTSLDNNGVNLPDMPVRWAKFTPAGASPGTRTDAVGGILLATELGVWSTVTSSGTTTAWIANNAGMGNVRTDMIKIRTSDKLIGVATHGRGFFTGTFNTIVPLPIALPDFTGRLQNNAAQLSWATNTEQNSRDFEIEKSTDGQGFFKIGWVAAAGNSTDKREYSFVDNRLSPVNYYRLRMNDRDGKTKLSNTIVLRYGAVKQNVWVVNNPFENHLDIRLATEAKTLNLQLINAAGAVVASRNVGGVNGQWRWALPGSLPRGTYVVRSVADGEVFTGKAVKQ